MRNKEIESVSSEATPCRKNCENNKKLEAPYLPVELRDYMEGDSKVQPGSYEWFQAAFHATAQCAIDNGEYLTEEFFKTFNAESDVEGEVFEMVEKMKKNACFEGLC